MVLIVFYGLVDIEGGLNYNGDIVYNKTFTVNGTSDLNGDVTINDANLTINNGECVITGVVGGGTSWKNITEPGHTGYVAVNYGTISVCPPPDPNTHIVPPIIGCNASLGGISGYCMGAPTGVFDTLYVNTLQVNNILYHGISAEAFIIPSYVSSFNGIPSDYRLKEDVEAISNSSVIDLLNPVQYKFKPTGEIQTGFIAHEIQELFPHLVEGEKDGKDYQKVNYFGLIAILVKEIQMLKKSLRS